MSSVGVLRGVSTLALPVALAITWWRRRGQDEYPGGEEHMSAGPDPALRSPSRRELAAMIRDGADLSGFDLRGIRLKKANLAGRNLADSDLSGARLARSRLAGSNLTGAVLDFADLTGADLRGAYFTQASLLETSFWDADLRGADLSRCRNLIMANFRHALYDRATRWPGRFDPRTVGAVPVSAHEGKPR